MQTIQTTKPLQEIRGTHKLSTRSILWLLTASLGLAFNPQRGMAVTHPQPPFQYPSALRVRSGADVQSVRITIESAGFAGSFVALTQGAAGGDFIALAPANCSPGQPLSSLDVCTVSVQFAPRAPGLRQGAISVLDGNGRALGTTLLSGIGLGSVGVFVPATINTVAGNGAWVFRGDGGPAVSSPIFLPGGMAADGAGDLFISDSSNNRIRRVDAASGIITTVAGNGSPGNDGDTGPATSASVNTPTGLVIDGAGNVIFADSANHAIRKLTLATGILSTIAGQLGQQGYTGDGSAASAALLNTPESVAFNASGDLFLSDTGNHVIRMVSAATGIISTVAGTGKASFSGDGGSGLSAGLNTPWGIAVDLGGNLYIADLSNQRIRKLTPGGIISTVVGTGTGTYNGDGERANVANVKDPAAVAVDVAGNLYVADSGNNLIRKVSATTGLIATVTGTGNPTFSGDQGSATLAGIYGPYALSLDSQGNLYFSDIFHHRIRELLNTQATLAFPALRVGRTSAAKPQTFENDGNDALTFTAVAPDINSASDPATTTCTVSSPLPTASTCVLGAEFSPQVTGTPVTASIQLQSDAANSASVLTLSGEVDALEPTSTVVTSSAGTSALGSEVTFTAVVSGDGTAPSGSVRFFDGSTLLGTSATGSSSTATFSIPTLTLGSHIITAAFTGDATNSPSTSTFIAQIVKQTPSVALLPSPQTTLVGARVTLTANVSASSIQPTGTITFMDRGNVLGAGDLNTSGTAAFTTSTLPAGTHHLSAIYAGDTNTLAGTSPAATQTVNPWTTSLALTSDVGTTNVGALVNFSVAITSTSTVQPIGSVSLTDGPALLATLSLDSTGHATYSLSTLTVGTHILKASFSGDATNAASQSPLLSQTVTQVPTSVILVASANPAIAGANLRLTATLSAPATAINSGALSGSITFTEGATLLGSIPVSGSGVATLDLSSLTVGQHSIFAHYTGNVNFGASSSAALSEGVQLAGTSVQLSSSSPTSIAGSAFTLTAIVSGTGGIPTGTVTFLDGSSPFGTATVNGSGQANLRVTSLSAGSHILTASFGGDPSDERSSSSSFTEIIQQAVTSISLAPNVNPSIAGVSLTILSSLTSNGSIPTGQITLREGSTTLASSLINITGGSTFNLHAITAGTHNLVATYAGDADHAASSATLVQVVQQGTSAINVASSRNPGIFAGSVILSARVTGSGNQPTGAVTFTDGSTSLGTANVDLAGNASLSIASLSIGDHIITVNYAGDLTHTAATPSSLIQRVQQTTATALTSSANPVIVGAPLRLVANVTGGSGASVTGTVSFTDGGTLLGSSTIDANGSASLTLSTLFAGTHLILASYIGDATSQASISTALAQPVNSAGTTVTVTSSANPTVVGSTLTLTAAVTSSGKAPTGTVTFLDGAIALGTVSTSNGIAILTTATLTAGQHAIVARYGGDSGTDVSTSGVLPEIAQQSTLTTLASSANPALTAQPILLTANVRNGNNAGGIVLFLDGAITIGSVPVDTTGNASLELPSLTSGVHALSARYAGDAFNLPSSSIALPQTVQLRSTTASITASSDTYLSGQTVTLVAVIHSSGSLAPTGSVTFTSGGASIGSAPVSASGAATLTFFPVESTYNVYAAYAGDAIYSGSTSGAYTLNSGPSTTFTMAASATALSFPSGGHATVDLTITSVKGFTDTLALGCLELPADATCTFSQDRPNLAGNGTTVIHLTVDTGNPLGSGAQAKVTGDPRPKTFIAGICFPIALLFGVLLTASRGGRRLPTLLSALLLLSSGIALTGCATSLQTTSTPAGSYTVRIMASGVSSGASQIVDLPLQVTR